MLLFYETNFCYLFRFYPLGKMENFIQSDCFCRYTTATVVPSLPINDNLVIEISGVVCKIKITLRSRITGGTRWEMVNKVGRVKNLSKI